MWQIFSSQVSLRQLSLGVVAGKPAMGWKNVRRFTPADFEVSCREDERTRANEVVAIEGLQSVDVRACIKHCPPPESNAMGLFCHVLCDS